MVNYKEGKIYKMVNKATNDFYIGSTTKKYLANRKGGHHMDSKQMNRQSPLMKAIREYGIESFDIMLIENYACDNVNELRTRERELINELKPSYNRQTPILTEEERKKYVSEYNKKYDELHPDSKRERRRKWYQIHKVECNEKAKLHKACECGASVRQYEMPRHLKTAKHQNLMSARNSLEEISQMKL